MAWHNDYGKRGEEKVYRYLLDKGYTVLERNWRVGHKEVDFVVLDGEILVIVEVKTRFMAEEYPEEILSYRKKKNLLMTLPPILYGVSVVTASIMRDAYSVERVCSIPSFPKSFSLCATHSFI